MKLDVVLSNHLVRYAVLAWSPALASDDEWTAYARLYTPQRTGPKRLTGGSGFATAAAAAPASPARPTPPLLDAIAAVERVASIQPRLVEAFNARRDEFGNEPGWFVLHEPGRLTLALLADGEWKLLCNRQLRPTGATGGRSSAPRNGSGAAWRPASAWC